MSRKNAPDDHCRICGKYGKLSFEHVPPQSAFNSERVVTSPIGEGLDRPVDEPPRGKIVQGGVGDFTLCGQCNNDTGSWYANEFAVWCYQGAKVLAMTDGNPKLIYLHYIYPLRILKQIITMAFSQNGLKFRELHPDLVEFVLNREKRWLNPRYRVFTYFNIHGTMRRIGDSMAMVNLYKGTDVIMVTEISHPPYGYVLTTDGTNPSDKITEISHFRRYEYDEWEVAPLYLPVLETHMPIPLDYRTKQEIIDGRGDAVA